MPYNLTNMQSIYHGQDEIVEITYNNSPVYQKSSGPDYTEPFYIQDASGSANTVYLSQYDSSAPALTIETSLDKSTWSTLGTTSSTPLEIQIPANGKVYLRCSTNVWANDFYQRNNYFNDASGNFIVGGNTMSLLYGSNFTGQETSFPDTNRFTFSRLFLNNTKVIDASNMLLPAVTGRYCSYYGMFSGCSNLVTGLRNLTTSGGGYLYSQMFANCTSLINPPLISATIAGNNDYEALFRGCTSLTFSPDLNFTSVGAGSFASMFRNCTALTRVGNISAAVGQDSHQYMFSGCTSLVTGPELPATTLVTRCYQHIFDGCSSLNYIKCLATSGMDTHTSYWLNGVAATGTFVKAAGSTWSTGVSGIPDNWTVVEE